jgi:hypothetical protein
MLKIPKKTAENLQQKIKKFQPIVTGIKARDVSEADTVTVIKDILAELFGYDKYLELTSEQQIRGTFCDLAVKIDGKIKYLIEVKAAGTDLNESHLRQAINYGSNEGIEWVVLSNASDWRLYRIKFGQPVEFEEVTAFNLIEANHKNEDDLQKLFLLCRDGIVTDAMSTFHNHAQILNKYTVAQIINSEPVISVVRRELRKLFPDQKIDQENIASLIINEVLKRDVAEGDKAKEAQQRIKRAANKLNKSKGLAGSNQLEPLSQQSNENPAQPAPTE